MPNDICTAPMQPFTVIARHSNQHIVRMIIIIIIITISQFLTLGIFTTEGIKKKKNNNNNNTNDVKL